MSRRQRTARPGQQSTRRAEEDRERKSRIEYRASSIEHRGPYDKLIEFCIIFLIIFTPLAYGAIQPWSVAVFEIVAALMAIFWLFKMLRVGTLEIIKAPLTLFIPLFITYVILQLYSRYSLLSTLYSHATRTELLKLISYCLIFFITLNTIKSKRQIVRILSVIVGIGFIMSVFYLMRYFGAKVPRGFINRDHFSAYLGMIIPFALGLLFVPSLSANRKPQTANRILLSFCIITMGAALFFTMSRGGILSFIAALLFMAVLIFRRKPIERKAWTLSAITVLIILTIAWLGATPVVERILSVKAEIVSRYFGGRLPVWQGTLGIIKDYPIFGTGPGTFNYVFPKYQSAEIITSRWVHAHSDVLEFISEVGIIGLVLFLVFGFWFLAYLFRRFNRRNDPWVLCVSVGLFASLAGIFLHSFTDFSLRIPANAILLVLILAITLVVLHLKKDRFGERLIFRKIFFRFSREATVTESGFREVLPEIFRVSFYPLVLIIFGFYIFACLRPAIADYYFRLALSSNKNAPAAIRCILNATRIDPENAKYHYYMGGLYCDQAVNLQRYNRLIVTVEQLKDAIGEYKKAVELNPMESKYHQSLAWVYGQLAKLSKPVSSLDSQVPAYIRMANKHFQTAISFEPNNPYRHRAFAIWLFGYPAEGNIKKGIAEYKKAVELNPELAKEMEEFLLKYKHKFELTAIGHDNY